MITFYLCIRGLCFFCEIANDSSDHNGHSIVYYVAYVLEKSPSENLGLINIGLRFLFSEVTNRNIYFIEQIAGDERDYDKDYCQYYGDLGEIRMYNVFITQNVQEEEAHFSEHNKHADVPTKNQKANHKVYDPDNLARKYSLFVYIQNTRQDEIYDGKCNVYYY